jgi:hypothetical protein
MVPIQLPESSAQVQTSPKKRRSARISIIVTFFLILIYLKKFIVPSKKNCQKGEEEKCWHP